MTVKGVDLGSLSIGTIAGAFLVFLATTIGNVLKRSTAIDLRKFDDRQELTKQLIDDIKRMEHRIAGLEERDRTFIRLFANVAGEVRVLTGHIAIAQLELKNDNIDSLELLNQTDAIKDGLNRISILMDEEKEFLTKSTSRPAGNEKEKING